MNITNGTVVIFRRQDGVLCRDVVRGEVFEQEILLAPYAPNETRQAVLLTEHSWCFVSDIIEVDPPGDDGNYCDVCGGPL